MVCNTLTSPVWWLFFLLGTLNNLGYVVVNSAAESLANNFNAANLLGAIPWANVGFGFIIRCVNAFYMEKTPYTVRVALNAAMLSLGLCMVIFASNFYLTLEGIVLIGASSSFGESVLLGYTRNFAGDGEAIGGWSSGTGMAGVVGAGLYLVLHAAEMSDKDIFIMFIPSAVIYFFAYAVLNHSKHYKPELTQGEAKDDKSYALLEEDGSVSSPNEISHVLEAQEEVAADGKPESGFRRLIRAHNLVLWWCIQLALVYFFEYVICTGFASHSLSKDTSGYNKFNTMLRKNNYVILSFCYQVGVLISRSSLSVIKIRRVEILTILQGCFFVLWLLQCLTKLVDTVWILFGVMVLVGLLGGASYVNIFYFIQHDPKIPPKDLELCINIAAIYINFGIVASCLFDIVAMNTFL